ncbi:MAG: hypothetical protein ACYC6Y_00255 [Thermoguttaceae bacterium]
MPERIPSASPEGTPHHVEQHWPIPVTSCFNDFYIHVIDNACWMKNAWPVKAQAIGGRHFRTSPDGQPYVDQNFDTYGVEYTFADGARLMLDGRCMPGCHNDHSSPSTKRSSPTRSTPPASTSSPPIPPPPSRPTPMADTPSRNPVSLRIGSTIDPRVANEPG